jgi:hypothetical protein
MIPKSTAWRVVTGFSRRYQAALPAPEKTKLASPSESQENSCCSSIKSYHRPEKLVSTYISFKPRLSEARDLSFILP